MFKEKTIVPDGEDDEIGTIFYNEQDIPNYYLQTSPELGNKILSQRLGELIYYNNKPD